MNRQLARPLGGVLAALAITTGLTACNSDASGGDSSADSKAADEICPTAETKGTIKIGMSAPLAVFAPLLLGVETGAFEDAGINVEIEPLPSAESLPLVARGQLDAQMTSLSSSHFNTLADDVDVKWILPMDNQAELPPGTPVPGYWSHVDVVGDADEPDLSALEGGGVSTPTGGSGISGLILDNALDEVGLGLGDVDLTAPLVGPDALNGLANGAVSAAWISAPLEVEAAKNPDLVPIAGYEPGVTGTAIMAGSTLLDQPELAVKFAAVLSKVIEEHLKGDYRQNPETVALLAKVEEVEESVIENSALLEFNPSFSMEGTEEFASQLQDFAMERGELEYDEPLDVAGLMDNRVSEALATCADVVG